MRDPERSLCYFIVPKISCIQLAARMNQPNTPVHPGFMVPVGLYQSEYPYSMKHAAKCRMKLMKHQTAARSTFRLSSSPSGNATRKVSANPKCSEKPQLARRERKGTSNHMPTIPKRKRKTNSVNIQELVVRYKTPSNRNNCDQIPSIVASKKVVPASTLQNAITSTISKNVDGQSGGAFRSVVAAIGIKNSTNSQEERNPKPMIFVPGTPLKEANLIACGSGPRMKHNQRIQAVALALLISTRSLSNLSSAI